MKQKYSITRDDEKQVLTIREYAELDKEMMSLLCEETYSQQELMEAAEDGIDALLAAIRTNNMYPPAVYAEPIAEAVM